MIGEGKEEIKLDHSHHRDLMQETDRRIVVRTEQNICPLHPLGLYSSNLHTSEVTTYSLLQPIDACPDRSERGVITVWTTCGER